MFSKIFKKSPDKSETALEVIPNLLQIQLTLAGSDAATVASDYWALGYIFGYHDAVLQALEVNDQVQSMAIMAVSYTRLFGDDGAKLLRQCIDLQTNQAFMKGVFAGGGEAVSYLSDGTTSWGLAGYLRENYE